MNCIECDNDACPVGKYCYPEWQELISHYKPLLNYKKGTVVIEEGQPVEGIYFIYSGKVKVTKKWAKGEEFIVRLARSGDILGHRGYGADKHYPISATAMSDVSVCYIPDDYFQRLLLTNVQFTYHLLMFYASELSNSETRMRNLARMTVKQRVADILLLLEKTFGRENGSDYLNIRLTRKEIANMAGTTYESVVRALSELSKEGTLSLNGKQIAIIDEDQLDRVLSME